MSDIHTFDNMAISMSWKRGRNQKDKLWVPEGEI